MKKIVIIDYGAGNIRSVLNAVRKVADCEAVVASKASDLVEASHVILPGVGAFDKAMRNLKLEPEILEFIKKHIADGKPFLGVCVGMQVLASFGYENGKVAGFDLIPGEVLKFEDSHELRVPHMGWNNIEIKRSECGKFPVEKFANRDFYFVHSFYFSCKNAEDVVAETNYGVSFPAIIAKDNIIATQFHPEKSGENGLEFLKEFLSL